jgi:prevent-host-death family protein
MQTIGMFDAKTHLPELVRNVQKGETYMLTNRNQEVAILISVSEYNRTSKEVSYDALRNIFKKNIFKNNDEITEFKNKGRR